MSWKQVKNNGNTLIFQRVDLPHHVLTVYKGSNKTWWARGLFNISYTIQLAGSFRNVCSDIIVSGIENVNHVLGIIKQKSAIGNINSLPDVISNEGKIVAIGEYDYNIKVSQGEVPEAKKHIVEPVSYAPGSNKKVSVLTSLIREMMNS